MAIKIGSNTVIHNNRKGDFNRVNFGSFTIAQLSSGSYNGTAVGDITYCSDLGRGSMVTWNGTEWVLGGGSSKFIADGGNIQEVVGSYRYNIFTTPGFLQITPAGGDVELVVIGGGGGSGSGGDSNGGGGGAGGIVYAEEFGLIQGNYFVLIGDGGTTDVSGEDSTAFGLTALGGGYGAARSLAAAAGGSGGGFGSYGPLQNVQPGLQPTANPGIPGLIQYGQPSQPGPVFAGGSSNDFNSYSLNANFNGSTILTSSPLSSSNIGRGGGDNSSPSADAQWGPVDYGSGGRGDRGAGLPGIPGMVMIRYPA